MRPDSYKTLVLDKSCTYLLNNLQLPLSSCDLWRYYFDGLID